MVNCLIKYFATKTCGALEVYFHIILTSALDKGELSAYSLGRYEKTVFETRFILEPLNCCGGTEKNTKIL
jgi:hypothetical protein